MINNYNLQPGSFNYNNLDVPIKFGMNLDKWLYEFFTDLGLSPNLNCTNGNCWQNSLFLKQGYYLYTNKKCKEYFNVENYISKILIDLGIISSVNNVPAGFGTLTLTDDSASDFSPCPGNTSMYTVDNTLTANNIELENGFLTWVSGTYPILSVTNLIGSVNIGNYVKITDSLGRDFCLKVVDIDPPNMYAFCEKQKQLHLYSNFVIPKSKNYNSKGSLYKWLMSRIVAWGIDSNPELLCCK